MPLEGYEEIVTHFKAPTLVLAGPGAGKTHLLADRVKRLLSSGVDKDNITVLTFGKDANRHMIEELINPKGKFNIPSDSLPHISTMHSLGLNIVEEKPRLVNLKKTDLQVQNEEEVKRLLFRDAALILRDILRLKVLMPQSVSHVVTAAILPVWNAVKYA